MPFPIGIAHTTQRPAPRRHTDFPAQAGPYVYLGDLYHRVGRKDDAVALWRRGANLFPADARLRRRLERVGGESAAAGDFREDLLCRLRVVTLHLPPLRERRQDIPAFLTAALERHGGNISQTARALGVHRHSLQRMLRRLGIASP